MQLKSIVFFVTLLASSLASPLSKRTAATIESDLTTINNDVTTLNTAINTFSNSNGNLIAALAIHTDATNLDTAVKKATNDTKATSPVTEADGRTILNQVETLQPNIISTLNNLVANKAKFSALVIGGVPALVRSDLTTLNTDTKAFENALLAIAPADLVSEANTVISAIDAAFTNAINAFANA